MCVAEQHAPQTTFPYRKEIESLGGDIIGEERTGLDRKIEKPLRANEEKEDGTD